MRKLTEIEAMLDEVNQKIDFMPKLLREMRHDPEAITLLAEEFAVLLHERKVLETNVSTSRLMAESLVSAKCNNAH